jgi:hypothetical protein
MYKEELLELHSDLPKRALCLPNLHYLKRTKVFLILPRLNTSNFGRPRHTRPASAWAAPISTWAASDPTPPHVPLFRTNQSRRCLGFAPPPHPSALPPDAALDGADTNPMPLDRALVL